MTRADIENAVERGVPFRLRMADGEEYSVPHRDYIAFPPRSTSVMVFDDEGRFFVLPVRTMTALVSEVEPS